LGKHFEAVRLRLLPACAVLTLHFFAAPAPVHAACTAFGDGVSWGTVSFNSLAEASGLTASRRNPGVLWTHNDGS
jgi:hypothetical protein